jgi:hypothetical protein
MIAIAEVKGALPHADPHHGTSEDHTDLDQYVASAAEPSPAE